MKKLASIAILSLASIFSLSAFGVTEQSGIFVGANGGWASPSSKPSLAGYSTKDRNYTAGASLGYNYALNKNVAAGVEANYSDFGKTDYSNSTGSGSFQNSALQLLLTGTYLMDSGFNTFVKLGTAHEQSSLTLNGDTNGKNSWLPAAAAGMGYEFLQNLNVYGQYERTFGDNWENATTSSAPSHANSLNVFSVGVNYTFPM